MCERGERGVFGVWVSGFGGGGCHHLPTTTGRELMGGNHERQVVS